MKALKDPSSTNTLNIGTFNIRGGLKDKTEKIVKEAESFNLDILALSDVRVKGQVLDSIGNYRVLLSGVNSGDCKHGVGLLINKGFKIKCLEFISERIMWVSLEFKDIVYRVVSVYSPCNGKTKDYEVLNKFYRDLIDIVCKKGNEKIILLGDFNARVGKSNSDFAKVLGEFGEAMNPNVNGKRLLNFCKGTSLVITNSFFEHKYFYSFVNSGNAARSLVDYVIVEKSSREVVLDTRVYRSFCEEANSDHYLVASRLDIDTSDLKVMMAEMKI